MISYYGAVFIGLAGLALFPDLGNPEEIFPTKAMELLPWWLAGIILAAALSALMSSIDSMLLITSSSIAEDLWNKMLYKGKLSEKKTILVSQISTVVIGVVAILIALNPFDSVFWLAVFAWAGLATCFGPPVILSLYWKGVTKWGAIAGMIVGPVVTVLWYLWPPIDIYEGGPAFIAALVTIVIVSLLTKAPHDEDFERMWADYNEQNEIGRPSFLESDYAYLKNMQADELRLKSDKQIVRDFLEQKIAVTSQFSSVQVREMRPLAQQPNNDTVIELIHTPYDLKGRQIVCYPNLLLLFKIEVSRLFLPPRTVYSSITVDLVRGEAARSNMFPESHEIQIRQDARIPRLISDEAAIETARKLVLRWLRHKFRIYKVPRIELIKQQEAYKAFFYTRDHSNEPLLVDSIKGVELDR